MTRMPEVTSWISTIDGLDVSDGEARLLYEDKVLDRRVVGRRLGSFHSVMIFVRACNEEEVYGDD